MQKLSITIPFALTALAALPAQITTSTTTVAVGNRPDEIALGDVDGDGDLDFAITADIPVNGVQLFLNDGAGNFALGGTIFVSSQTRSVRLADLDGDGDLDLAVSTAAAVAVLSNLGGGAYGTATFYPVGVNPRGLTIADFDGSSTPDLAVANRDSNTVSVLLNLGGGIFGPALNIPVGIEPRNVIAADFDRDGSPDLAVGNHDSRDVTVLRNLGGGTFAATATLPVGANVRPEWVTAADTDGDGDLELVVALGEVAGRVGIYDNPGNGAFAGQLTVFVNGNEPGFVAAVDLDGDQRPELVTANEDGNTLSIMSNVGGAFAFSGSVPAGTHPDHMAAGDIDRDGDIDLVCSNRDSNTVTVLRNDTVGGATRPAMIQTAPVIQGTTIPVELSAPTAAGMPYAAGLSFDAGPALTLPDNRTIPVGPSVMLTVSLTFGNSVFQDSFGVLDGSGHAFPRLLLPTTISLSGIDLFGAFVVLDQNRPLGIGDISSQLAMTIQ